MRLTFTFDATTTRSATVHLAGDLDFTTTDHFVATVHRLLDENTGLQKLHLDFAGVSFCDSAGLSGLLLVHRRTSSAGVDLSLDHRPAQLDRVLVVTGMLEHLTATPGTDTVETADPDEEQDETVG